MTERVELCVDKVVAGGDGLARLDDGRVAFVPGALPGERVVVEVVQERRDFARARLVEVIEPHAGRVEPPCPFVAARCGGCSWQHVESSVQRDLKIAIVADALRRTGKLVDPIVTAAPPLAPFGFRTSMRVGVDDSGRAALRASASHDLVAIDHCLVAHPRIDELLSFARFPGADEVSLRCSATTGERVALIEPRAAGRHASLPDDVGIGADATITEVVAGVALRVSAGSFFQTRHDGAEALVGAVRAAARDTDPGALVVDAYAGVAIFAATVHQRAPAVVIESSRSAAADAKANLRSRDATVVRSSVEDWLSRRGAASAAPGLVVADPARAGLGRTAAVGLAELGAPVIVLVSCDPVSLARDGAILAQHGYRHVASEIVDLFPHTPHVEVVTRFERQR